MTENQYLLETKRLKKQIGSFRLMESLDFHLEKGEIRGLIGPNGAGKSSLMHLITGKTEATSGSILFKGQDITEFPLHERTNLGIGIKFQISNVFIEETVVNNIQIAIQEKNCLWKTMNDKRIHEEVDDIIETIGLQDKKWWLAKELSHGEKQWLEIGMVLAVKPSLLMLDEPTSGMTKYETEKTAELIFNIRDNSDTTILIVEHDFPFIKQICDKITVMNFGAKLAEGSVEDIENNQEVQNVYLGGH